MKDYRQRKIVALLPMKANSTRVKGKNFRDFCGKPLFRWTLDSLLKVDEIDLIVINTDARDILAEHCLTESDRILIRDRKQEICGDDVSMNLVLADDVSNLDCSLFLMTHTTNPLLSTKSIREAIAIFNDLKSTNQADSLFSVNKVQTRFYRKDSSPVNHDPQNLIPTQKLEPWFEENSNLYIFTRDSFANTNSRIGQKPILFETPLIESIDIDNEQDWDIAVVAASYIKKQQVLIK